MSYIYPCNEIDVFSAVRWGHWAELAAQMAEYAKTALATHKASPLDTRPAYRARELKAEGLLLPKYPILGIFVMQHKEGSDKMLAALKNDAYVKRMDSSQLVMHLVKTNVSGFIWALNEGWDTHFGLFQSRQIKMNWNDVRTELKTAHERETVDTWMRKWAKRNPLILAELNTPTFMECKTLLVDHLHQSPKELGILLKDDTFRGFFQAMDSLGQWDSKKTMKQRALALRPYFTQESVAQMSLPNDFVMEYGLLAV